MRKLKRRGGDLWRADARKEALRAVFAGDRTTDEVAMLLDRFCSKASRSGLKPNNTRHEGLNRRVRLIINRAYGFHTANAALALIMLTLGPINHVLPHERQPTTDP